MRRQRCLITAGIFHKLPGLDLTFGVRSWGLHQMQGKEHDRAQPHERGDLQRHRLSRGCNNETRA